MAEPADTARRPRRLDPATVELAIAVGTGALVALVVLVVFPDLVMLVLDLVADAIGGATRPR